MFERFRRSVPGDLREVDLDGGQMPLLDEVHFFGAAEVGHRNLDQEWAPSHRDEDVGTQSVEIGLKCRVLRADRHSWPDEAVPAVVYGDHLGQCQGGAVADQLLASLCSMVS